jgi:hypothetical protein
MAATRLRGDRSPPSRSGPTFEASTGGRPLRRRRETVLIYGRERLRGTAARIAPLRGNILRERKKMRVKVIHNITE